MPAMEKTGAPVSMCAGDQFKHFPVVPSYLRDGGMDRLRTRTEAARERRVTHTEAARLSGMT